MFIRDVQGPAFRTWKRVANLLNHIWSKILPLQAIEVFTLDLKLQTIIKNNEIYQ